MSRFPRSTPEAQGIPSSAISAFIHALEHDNDSVHSFVLLRHGHLVAEGWWNPYQSDDTHSLYSLTKSFTSSAIGLLVSNGQLSLDDTILSFFPEDAPPDPSPNLQAMRIRHLLSMSTGHDSEPFINVPVVEGKSVVHNFFIHPIPHEPGTHFLYNSAASHVLSELVEKVSGQRLADFLKPRLLDPLGVERFFWETLPHGVNTGGWGLHLTTGDIAAFGQLYLNKGQWHGQQLIPADWVALATSFKVPNGTDANSDWAQGYCYQFWRCRHNNYRGDGAFGQYCIVMPDYDAVLAINSGLGDMQKPLNAVWEHLLPAMQSSPLPADAAAQATLSAKTASLQLPMPKGADSPTAKPLGKTYLVANQTDGIHAIRLDSNAAQTTLTLTRSADQVALAFGHGHWLSSEVLFHPNDLFVLGLVANKPGAWKIAASGAWTDKHTFTGQLWWVETPFAFTFTCHFDGDSLTVTQNGNVGASPTVGATLHASAQR